jgi:hypothetical protein
MQSIEQRLAAGEYGLRRCGMRQNGGSASGNAGGSGTLRWASGTAVSNDGKSHQNAEVICPLNRSESVTVKPI